MPAGEGTLKDIEKKAAGEVASLFGDKSRKIAILAEAPKERKRFPTSAIMESFLPTLKELLTALGYQPYIPKDEVRDRWLGEWDSERFFYPSGEAKYWVGQNSAGREIRIALEDHIPPLRRGINAKEYAKRSTNYLLYRTVGGSWKDTGQALHAKKVDPAFSEKVTQFFEKIGTELEQQPEKRIPTFIDEAEWYKRYMHGEKVLAKHPRTGKVTEGQLPRPPWAEVEVYPFYGEEELLEAGKKISEKYGEEQISLGIMGHAGGMFGGVDVLAPEWKEAFKTVDIDTAFIAACSMTERPEVCESFAVQLSDDEKKSVTILAQNMAWGTSLGQDAERPSLASVFHPGARVGSFEATPEAIEAVQEGMFPPGSARIGPSELTLREYAMGRGGPGAATFLPEYERAFRHRREQPLEQYETQLQQDIERTEEENRRIQAPVQGPTFTPQTPLFTPPTEERPCAGLSGGERRQCETMQAVSRFLQSILSPQESAPATGLSF
jgi:hypothetical protein